VGDARYLYVAELAEGPAGIVVDAFLRIVGGPVLVVEQGIGYAAIGLVHAQNVTGGGESARLGLGFFGGLSGRRFGRSIARSIACRGGIRVPCPCAAASTASTASSARLLGRHHDRNGCGGAGDLAALILQHAPEVGLRAGTRVVGRKHVGGGAFGARFLDGAFRLEVEVAEEELVVAGEVVERGEYAGLFVVVVVALRPLRLGKRLILLEPGAGVLIGAQRA